MVSQSIYSRVYRLNLLKVRDFLKVGQVIAPIISVLALSTPAQAVTLVGFAPDSNNTGNTISNFSQQFAVGFTLPTGTSYGLDNISLRLSGYTNPGDTALLQIYADSAKTSNNPNQATLVSGLLFNYPSSSSNSISDFSFTPTTAFAFSPDTRYWLLVDVSLGNFTWISNTLNPITLLSGATYEGFQFSSNDGVSYSSIATNQTFQINATPVPLEFSPIGGIGLLGGAWLLRKGLKTGLKRKSAN